MSAKPTLHDWICDNCGRKIYGRRKPPKRCHGMPMRPMGEPWCGAADAVYQHAEKRPGWLTGLPDDYWISPRVLERLQKLVDESNGQMLWSSSARRRGGPVSTRTYQELAT